MTVVSSVSALFMTRAGVYLDGRCALIRKGIDTIRMHSTVCLELGMGPCAII